MLAKHGKKFEERQISIAEVMEAARSGRLTEIFGCGTAAVISPVGAISYKGETLTVNNDKVGPVSEWLLDRLTGIQTMRYPDEFGWITKF